MTLAVLGIASCRPATSSLRFSRRTPPKQETASRADSQKTYWAIAPEDTGHHPERELPGWAHRALLRSGFCQRYGVFYRLNPFYLNGHFDSDSLNDLALQITQRSSNKRGLAIIHFADNSVHILGAGTPLPNGDDDFKWLWSWEVENRNSLKNQPVAGDDVLRIGPTPWQWTILWWNGHAYKCMCHPSTERAAPNQRMKLSWRGGRLKGNGSILMAAAAPRSLCAIR